MSGTLNGTTFERRSIHPWGDRFFIELPAQLCRGAGVHIGELVDLTVIVTGDRVPAELADLLSADPVAKTAWSQLTEGRRRQLSNQIADGRRPTTRKRRAEACIRDLTGLTDCM